MMSSCLALPREGHLQAVFHIFSYLGAKHNAELVYDPTDHVIDMNMFQNMIGPRQFMPLAMAVIRTKRLHLISQNLEEME